MNLSLSEKHRYRAFLSAGVAVSRNGRPLTLADVQVGDNDFSLRPAAQTSTSPKDFSEALAVELKSGTEIKEAVRQAAEKHPTLYRQYCNELTDPAPSAPCPDTSPVERFNGVDPAGSELAKHMAAGGELKPGAPGYREWIESFRRPE